MRHTVEYLGVERVSDEAREPNRQLTDAERATLFAPIIAEVRERLARLSGGDEALLWALRRN